MNIFDIFTRYRKTEPISIITLRAFVVTILIAALLGYITGLIITITNELPITQNSSRNEATLPIPDFIFYFNSKFSLNCSFLGPAQLSSTSCLQYIYQPTLASDGYYYGAFSARSEVNFMNDPNNSPSITFLATTVGESSYDPLSYDFMFMMAIDSEKDPINVQYAGLLTDLSSLPISTQEQLTSNTIVMVNGAVTRMGFTRSIRESITPRFSDVLGVTPKLDREPYIMMSSPQSIPVPGINTTQLRIYVTSMIIQPLNFIVNTETERRGRTLISELGIVGGAWSICAFIYGFLFGDDIFHPFGCLQGCCFRRVTQNKLKSTLPLIPFVHQDTIDISRSTNDQNTVISRLQDRINALETFLQDYVVDPGYLEGIQTKSNRNQYNMVQSQQPYYSTPVNT